MKEVWDMNHKSEINHNIKIDFHVPHKLYDFSSACCEIISRKVFSL